MALTLTPHQQQAVDASGGSLLVSAAAGSGKTAVLTQRVIRLLTGEHPVPADRLIIVTFTVAAADEMRRRIGDSLSALLEEDPMNEWLQSQQLLLAKAKICTIHSLCSGLIRDNLQKLGLSGDLKIAEEADMAVLQKQAVDEVLEEHYAASDEAFLSLVEFVCLKNDQALVSLVHTVYDFIRSFPFPLDFLDRVEEDYRQAEDINHTVWTRGVVEHASAALRQAASILETAMEEMKADEQVREKYLDAFSSDLAQIRQISAWLEQGNLEQASLCCRSFQRKSLSAVRKYPDPAFLEQLKNRRKQAADILGEMTRRYLGFSNEEFLDDIRLLLPHIHTLFQLVRETYARIEDKKQDEGVLDYADLEHYALRLLVRKTETGVEKTETARELSAQYEEIMIDECQDINEVQNLIFTLLSREESNLFQVGDVKQSIYRFRKAEPGLFLEKRKTYAPYDPARHTARSKATITLETNFRSRSEVCSLVNFLFSRLMTEQMGELAYGEEEYLAPGAQYPDSPLAVPELHLIDYDREGEEEKTEAEARYIARRIRALVDEGYQVTGKEGTRPCTYRDFALLLRSSHAKAPIYAQALKQQGIPSFSESSDGYFDSYEVSVILNLLRTIDNPLLDVPLLSVLLSPMFGFTADQAARLRLIQRNVPLYLNVLSAAREGDGSCGEFLSLLAELRRKAASLRVDQLIQEIYTKTDFLAIANVMEEGRQKDANLRLLLTYAQRYEGGDRHGLSGFLRYLDRVMESGGDFSCANTLSARADCVQIMSIHKSKGLEFPICILADCSKRFNKTDVNSSCQLNARLGFSMKINDPATFRRYNSLPFEAIRLQSEKESISEEMRVLYVALTRAKEKLILLLTCPKVEEKLKRIANSLTLGEKETLSPYEVFRASGYDDWILSALFFHPGFASIRRRIGRGELPSVEAGFPLNCVWEPQQPVEEEAQPSVLFTAEPSDELLSQLERSLTFEYPQAELTRIPAKLTATAIAKQSQGQRVHLNTRPAFLQKEGFTPAQKGTILHSFMQFANFSAAEEDLEGEIYRLIQQQYLTEAEGKALNRKKIQAFFQSSLYQRMKRADKLLREYKFLYFRKASDIDPDLSPEFSNREILIQGIADCLLFEADGITIVDYKTDVTNDREKLAEQYRDQLRVYREAIQRSFAEPVKQCLLYSLHMETEIEVIMKENVLF